MLVQISRREANWGLRWVIFESLKLYVSLHGRKWTWEHTWADKEAHRHPPERLSETRLTNHFSYDAISRLLCELINYTIRSQTTARGHMAMPEKASFFNSNIVCLILCEILLIGFLYICLRRGRRSGGSMQRAIHQKQWKGHSERRASRRPRSRRWRSAYAWKRAPQLRLLLFTKSSTRIPVNLVLPLTHQIDKQQNHNITLWSTWLPMSKIPVTPNN